MHTPVLFPKNKQGGSVLLEGLIALLIFSIGIIALMGLQAAAINNSGAAKLRADASFLANQIIGHIWSDRDDAKVLLYEYNNTAAVTCSSSNATVCNWLKNVRQSLPGAVSLTQRIQITNISAGVNEVTVIVRWSSPQGAHKFETTTQIGG